MKNKNTKKIIAGLGTCLIGLMTVSNVIAYGPARPTYTIEKPAEKVTFNAITNNPNYGDERNFTLAKPYSDKSAGGWSADSINVDKDEEYLVRVYVHNNAAANLNLKALNTKVKVSLPTNTAKEISLNAIISADNASPKEVWDNVIFKSNKEFNIAYIAGSAFFKNNINANPGFKLPDSIMTQTGAKIGYQQMDGVLPGCYQYSGIVTFRVKVQMKQNVALEINKTVRKAGTKDWKKSIIVNPGEKVDYLIHYQNISDAIQQNIIMNDVLPKQFKVVDDSLVIKRATIVSLTNQNLQDLITASKGLNIGNYAGKAGAYLRLTVETPKNDELKNCGVNVFRNTVIGGSQQIGKFKSYADVTINKTNCQKETPKEQPKTPQEQPKTPKEQPKTPESLPETGPAEMAISLLGMVLVTMAIVYWYRSTLILKEAQDKTESDQK